MQPTLKDVLLGAREDAKASGGKRRMDLEDPRTPLVVEFLPKEQEGLVHFQRRPLVEVAVKAVEQSADMIRFVPETTLLLPLVGLKPRIVAEVQGTLDRAARLAFQLERRLHWTCWGKEEYAAVLKTIEFAPYVFFPEKPIVPARRGPVLQGGYVTSREAMEEFFGVPGPCVIVKEPPPGAEIEHIVVKGRQTGPLALEGVFFPLRERPERPEVVDDGQGNISVNINPLYAFVKDVEESYVFRLRDIMNEASGLPVTQELLCGLQSRVWDLLIGAFRQGHLLEKISSPLPHPTVGINEHGAITVGIDDDYSFSEEGTTPVLMSDGEVVEMPYMEAIGTYLTAATLVANTHEVRDHLKNKVYEVIQDAARKGHLLRKISPPQPEFVPLPGDEVS